MTTENQSSLHIENAMLRLTLQTKDIKKYSTLPTYIPPKTKLSESEYNNPKSAEIARVSKAHFEALVKALKKHLDKMMDCYWEFDATKIYMSFGLKTGSAESVITVRNYLTSITYLERAEIALEIFLTNGTTETFSREKIVRDAQTDTVTIQKGK